MLTLCVLLNGEISIHGGDEVLVLQISNLQLFPSVDVTLQNLIHVLRINQSLGQNIKTINQNLPAARWRHRSFP